jgi:peptide deformylase
MGYDMSEFITINTDVNTKPDLRVTPLPLYGESHPLMHTEMPDYDVSTLPNREMTTLVERMKMTMRLYSGVGLSANQCGVKAKVFLIGTDDFQIVCINPEIVAHGDEFVKKREGCLSFPGLFLNLNRYESVQVEFYNEFGELQNLYLDGLTAQCFQHEFDHMRGIDFTELAGPVQIQLAKQKQAKIVKKIKRTNK